MKYFLSALVFFAALATSRAQTTKQASKAAEKQEEKKPSLRPIPITMKPYVKKYIYLGCYYGKGKTLVDSALMDENSHGFFKHEKKYTPGIYFVVSPNYTILFELLMDDKQQMTIEADSTKKDEPVIKGSPENDLFKAYSLFSVEKGRKMNDLSEAYKKATTKSDSARFKEELVKENKLLQDYREDIIEKHPTSLLTALLNAMKTPDYPSIPVVNGKADSLYPYRYVKDHYFDGMDFNDDRLLRTPFYESKVDTYFKNMVVHQPDSIFKEINYMLLYARTGKEMFPYLLTKFTNEYIQPKIMGDEAVFVKIYDNFFAKGDTTYLNTASRKTITERYYSIVANLVGNPAPSLDLTDTLGKTVSLYNLRNKFTFVVFWDPSCGHCKEEIPRIDSIYKARWKSLDVKIYSVNVSTATNTEEEMKKFIHEKHIHPDWLLTAQSKAARDAEQAAGLPNFRQLYDVNKTPTMYLLDEKKRIIAKQLSVEQFNDMISAKLKKTNKEK